MIDLGRPRPARCSVLALALPSMALALLANGCDRVPASPEQPPPPMSGMVDPLTGKTMPPPDAPKKPVGSPPTQRP